MIGKSLSGDHHQAIADLLGSVGPGVSGKGAVYLSPLAGRQDSEKLLQHFLRLKQAGRLPVFIYLIQRL